MFDYTDYDIFWINCSENRERYNHMKEILDKNFSNHICHHIEAIMHKPKYNGITMSHMVAVMKGMTLGKPFLILEDDIIGGNDKSFATPQCKSRPVSNEDPDVRGKDVENDNPDAIYLGVSYWGNMKMGRKKLLAECMGKDEKVVLINNKVFMKKGARGEDWNDNFFRISDMYGAHAILYISKQYMVETLKICILAASENKPHDIYLPKLQKKYLVLGQKYPTFYQYGKLGGQENGTKINFSGVRKITS